MATTHSHSNEWWEWVCEVRHLGSTVLRTKEWNKLYNGTVDGEHTAPMVLEYELRGKHPTIGGNMDDTGEYYVVGGSQYYSIVLLSRSGCCTWIHKYYYPRAPQLRKARPSAVGL
jgi:hypothetical protein